MTLFHCHTMCWLNIRQTDGVLAIFVLVKAIVAVKIHNVTLIFLFPILLHKYLIKISKHASFTKSTA